MARRYQRETRYTARLSLGLSPEQYEALEAAADKAGWSLTEAARQCIEAGLPTVRQRLRPSRRPAARPSTRQEGGAK